MRNGEDKNRETKGEQEDVIMQSEKYKRMQK